MVEVFKTNVKEQGHAALLIDQIHQAFPDYESNFDLEDCDKILRVKCATGTIESPLLLDLLKTLGFNAEALQDHHQPGDGITLAGKKELSTRHESTAEK